MQNQDYIDLIHLDGWNPKSGHCLYNKETDLYYINILKNASTTLQSILDWDDYNLITGTQYIQHLIVVLRDPVDRYISATNMFAGNRQVRTDAHLLPQTYWLDGIPIEQTDFFYLNDTILEDIKQFYNIDINTNIRNKVCKKKYVDIIDDSFIKDIYESDYKLINSVTFRNGVISENGKFIKS